MVSKAVFCGFHLTALFIYRPNCVRLILSRVYNAPTWPTADLTDELKFYSV